MDGNILQAIDETPLKLLLIGDSGAGKTGAVFSLAEKYELVWADFDSGLDIIRDLAKKKPEYAKRIFYRSFSDEMGLTAGKLGPKNIPKAWTNFISCMENFKLLDGKGTETGNLGPVTSWGPNRVLVVDSLTHAGNAALRLVQTLKGRQFENPSQPDWGEAQQQVEKMLSILYSPSIKCHVIVCCHVNWYENEATGEKKGLPRGPGQALSPVIPTYFNTMVVAKRTGSGPTMKRTLSTIPTGGVEAKLPLVGTSLPTELPIETGLMQIFKAMKG